MSCSGRSNGLRGDSISILHCRCRAEKGEQKMTENAENETYPEDLNISH